MLRLRQRFRRSTRPRVVRVVLVQGPRPLEGTKGHRDPAGALLARTAATVTSAVRRGTPPHHRYQAQPQRPLPLCVLLGDGRTAAVRRPGTVASPLDGN